MEGCGLERETSDGCTTRVFVPFRFGLDEYAISKKCDIAFFVALGNY